MTQPQGRYAVCDEARRAPNNRHVLPDGSGHHDLGEDGESGRFDELSKAQHYAEHLWESQGRHHLIVIKDKTDGDKVVQAFESEPRDTQPRESDADETRRIRVLPKMQ